MVLLLGKMPFDKNIREDNKKKMHCSKKIELNLGWTGYYFGKEEEIFMAL